MRAEVNRILEQIRKEKTIGSSLEAEVTLYADEALLSKLAELGDELRFVLLTSKAEIKPLAQKDVEEGELKGFAVKRDEESLCSRCVENVDGKSESRQFA